MLAVSENKGGRCLGICFDARLKPADSVWSSTFLPAVAVLQGVQSFDVQKAVLSSMHLQPHACLEWFLF